MFLEGERVNYLSEDDKTKLCRGSTDKITAMYYDLVSEVVTVVSKGFLVAHGDLFSLSSYLDLVSIRRQGKRSLHCKDYAKVHKDELGLVLMPQITSYLTQTRSVHSYFLIFRFAVCPFALVHKLH